MKIMILCDKDAAELIEGVFEPLGAITQKSIAEDGAAIFFLKEFCPDCGKKLKKALFDTVKDIMESGCKKAVENELPPLKEIHSFDGIFRRHEEVISEINQAYNACSSRIWIYAATSIALNLIGPRIILELMK